MSGRVLNFSEFFDKYSKESSDDKKSIESFTKSSSNFEVGFDDSTYSQTQIGPNRPISTENEPTPPQPGEKGTRFTATADSEMEAPAETEEIIEVPEPEASANPKKMSEKMGYNLVKDFDQYVNESNVVEYVYDDEWSDRGEEDPFAEDETSCKECGQEFEEDEQGESVCGCNM